MSDVNDFDDRTSEQVIAELRKTQREVQNLRRQFHKISKAQQPTATYVAKVTEEAAKLESGNAGKGKAEIQSIKHTGDVVRKSSPTDFYNFSLRTIEAGSYVTLVTDPHSGRLVIPPSAGEGYVPYDFVHGGSDIPGGFDGFGDWVDLAFVGLINGVSVSTSDRRDISLDSEKLTIGNTGYRHFVLRINAKQFNLSYDGTLPMPFQIQPVINNSPYSELLATFSLPPRSGVSTFSFGSFGDFTYSFTLDLDKDDTVHMRARTVGRTTIKGQAAVGPGVTFL